MKQKAGSVYLFLLFIVLVSCQQKQYDQFFEYVNNYQVDSLQNLLDDDFQLTRTYVDRKENKISFLNDYLKWSKSLNAKFNIVKTISANEPKTYIVKDESDYFKYLKITSPSWKIIIKRNAANKVREVIIDTTSAFHQYATEMKSRQAEFVSWLKAKHFGENVDDILSNNSLLHEALKLFYESGK